jgi:hypothetical protein
MQTDLLSYVVKQKSTVIHTTSNCTEVYIIHVLDESICDFIYACHKIIGCMCL